MRYRRMPIEVESPEQMGYDKIRNNLSESSYVDARTRDFDAGMDLRDLVLCYGSHLGHEALRDLIARDGPGLTRDHVLLTIGAAGALFIIASSLLEQDDELVVVRPNYATNIETPLAIGAKVRYIDLRFEEGFGLRIDKVEEAITAKTRYLSVTYPHNPTGACLEEAQIRQLVRIAEENGIFLLVDETYREMVFGRQLPLAATYSSRVISVSSISKTYGLPGLRTGWIICRETRLMETFLAAKEQIHICGPVLDEELAYRYLLQKDAHVTRIREDIWQRFETVKKWMQQQDDLEWVEPRGGCVCFPRVRKPEKFDSNTFYRVLLEKYATYVGSGHWFDMPGHYMRIGFGWPSPAQLDEGLLALQKTFRELAG